MKRFAILIVGAVLVGMYFGKGNDEATLAPTATASVSQSLQTSSASSSCLHGQPSTGEIVSARESADVYTAPSTTAARLKNEKASAILKKTHYHVIDTSTTVEVVCEQDDWREVQIVTPDWLTHVKGWVQASSLKGIERTASGTRILTEGDFRWDRSTSPYKEEIVVLVNRIAAEHEDCEDADPSSVSLSGDRSSSGDPVFYVTCGMSSRSSTPFNVWFRPTDADRSFSAVPAIGQGNAVLACRDAARAAATIPSSVDFSAILDVAYSARPDGRASLSSSFTATNAMNVESRYNIRCLFDGTNMIERTITQAP
jgi:hypothetical protein